MSASRAGRAPPRAAGRRTSAPGSAHPVAQARRAACGRGFGPDSIRLWRHNRLQTWRLQMPASRFALGLLARSWLPALVLIATVAAALPAAAAGAGKVTDPASPTILITGSNRGVGLALANEFAGKGWNVIATCRTPGEATELNALAKQNPKVIVEALDVTSVPAM